MKTIEERAIAYSQECEYINGDTCYVQKECRKWGYIAGAKDQDSISRAEERKKCLNEVYAWIDYHMDAAPCEVDNFINELRKAIE